MRARPLRAWRTSPAASSAWRWRVVVGQAWANRPAIRPALSSPPAKLRLIRMRRRAGWARAVKMASQASGTPNHLAQALNILKRDLAHEIPDRGRDRLRPLPGHEMTGLRDGDDAQILDQC